MGLKKKSHSSRSQFGLVFSLGLFYSYRGRMGGDQISIIAIPVISVIPQVCLLSRNDWCWFQQFYQLVYCAIRCFPCQNTPMASEDRKKISFPQPLCTSRKLQHISESCETASPFLCRIFPFAKQLWFPFHLLVWLSLCRRGSQNSIFIIKKKISQAPNPLFCWRHWKQLWADGNQQQCWHVLHRV